MASEQPESSPDEIRVTVKSSADQKYSIAVSPSLLVKDFKALLEPQCSIPKDRQRLIYSGRVLKDHETLASYKIQSGHTIHLVKSAAPPPPAASAAAAPAVPQNIASGAGAGNPLAGLTGARYAGQVQLPSASMFGPDGGMGPPPSEEQLVEAMSSPMFQQSMNQMLQNPQMLDYIINSSPNLQGMGPQVRQMMQSEQFRQMMTNPEVMRQMMNMNRMFGGGANPFAPPGQAQAFPEPGRTDQASTTGTAGTTTTTDTTTAPAAANPFSMLFPGQNGAAANPFGALLNPAATGNPAGTGNAAGAGAGANPMFSPELFNLMMGLGAGGAGAGAAPAAPEDTRPPEERYEGQLRQLNELGFFDFDRNVRALRRSGGNVQGAIEALLDGAV